jgi:hypothetical protein
MGDWSVVPEASESDWSVVPEAKGYDPRASARGMRPEPKPDDVDEIAGDYGKRDVRRTLQGVNDLVTLPGDAEAAKARRDAQDPIQQDPLAGMLVQGILAHGAGAFTAGATGVPILGQAAQGAVQAPEDPLTGAALSMIPGVPGAVGQADRAIGRAAQARVSAGKSFVPAGTAAGTAAGTMIGHRAVPYVGAPIGAALGAKGGAALGRLADRGVGALGQRHLLRTAAAAPAVAPAELEAILAQTEPPPARASLAPLVPEPLPAPPLPRGAFGSPTFDEFGMPLTNPGQASANHATLGGATVPNLRADVIRDAQAFRAAPPDPVHDALGSQLAESVRLLDELRAGKITPKQALDAGLPPAVVAKVAR